MKLDLTLAQILSLQLDLGSALAHCLHRLVATPYGQYGMHRLSDDMLPQAAFATTMFIISLQSLSHY